MRNILPLSYETRCWIFWYLWKMHLPIKLCLFISGTHLKMPGEE